MDSHIKVKGLLVGKINLNPSGRTMWVWLKLKLTPKGDFCEVSIMAFFLLQISLCTALSDTWMRIFSYFPSQTTEVRPKSANDEHPRHFRMGVLLGKQITIFSTFRKVNDYHLLRVLALLHLVQTSMDDSFMVRSSGVLTFVYFYQLGKTAWTSTLFFLVTFTDVTRFEINVETLLFACANFFINWLRYKSSLRLQTVSWSVKTKADHC